MIVSNKSKPKCMFGRIPISISLSSNRSLLRFFFFFLSLSGSIEDLEDEGRLLRGCEDKRGLEPEAPDDESSGCISSAKSGRGVVETMFWDRASRI